MRRWPDGPSAGKGDFMEYVCDLCGFLYDEDVKGPMPDNYACPLCGGDRGHFQLDA